MKLIVKKIKFISIFCAIIALFSCKNEDNFKITDDKNEHQMYIEINEPDKIIEDLIGTLRYDEKLNLWTVNHFISGTIDSIERYLIVDMANNKFSFEEEKQVRVSGFCYKIPADIILDLAVKNDVVFPAGMELYYIEITNMIFTSCDSSNEEVTFCEECTMPQENLPWLKKLIDLSENDKTGNYWGCIWLEKYKGKDIFVTNMMLGSGGVMYYFFDCSGTCITPENPSEYGNPIIEAFVGKLSFKQVDKEEFHTFIQNMKFDTLLYSTFSFSCK